MNKTIIFFLLGKSTAGKNTVFNSIPEFDDTVARWVPMTTRNPKPHEKNGVHYSFISKNIFIKKVESGDIVEHRKETITKKDGKTVTCFYGYQSPPSDVVIMNGNKELFEKFSNNPDYIIIPIYISIPEDERLFRMIRRESRLPSPDYRAVARQFIHDNETLSDEYLKSIGINKSNTFENIDRSDVTNKVKNYIQYVLSNKSEFGV